MRTLKTTCVATAITLATLMVLTYTATTVQETNTLVPYYSKTTGLPNQNLFIPPDQIPPGLVYFTLPF